MTESVTDTRCSNFEVNLLIDWTQEYRLGSVHTRPLNDTGVALLSLIYTERNLSAIAKLLPALMYIHLHRHLPEAEFEASDSDCGIVEIVSTDSAPCSVVLDLQTTFIAQRTD